MHDDGSSYQTRVTRQYEVDGASVILVAKPRAQDACRGLTVAPGCLDAQTQAGTISSQLMAAPRDGVYGHGVAFDAEIWAYGLGGEGSVEQAMRSAAAAGTRQILHLPIGAAPLTDERRNALRTASSNSLLTMRGGATAEAWADYSEFASALLLVGAIDQGGTLRSSAAAAGKDAFLVVPYPTDTGYTVASWKVDCIGLGPLAGCYLGVHRVNAYGAGYYPQAVASGAAALLASAYPYLSARQIRSLMLTTARDVGATGVDEVYGHGVLDLDRATRPVGALAVPTAATVGGAAADLGATRLSLGAAFGDALADNGLLAAGVVFDDFGRPFKVGLDRRVGRQRNGPDLAGLLSGRAAETGTAPLGDGMTLHLARSPDGDASGQSTARRLQTDEPGGPSSVAFDVAAGPLGALRLGVGLSPESVLGLGAGELALTSGDLGVLSTGAAHLPQFGLLRGGTGLGLTRPVAPGHDIVVGLLGSGTGVDFVAGNQRLLQAVSRHKLADGLTVGLGVGLLEEAASFLGSESRGAFGEGIGSRAAVGSLLGRYVLGAYALEGSWTIAAARPESAADGMLSDMGAVRAEAWTVGLLRRGVVAANDRLASPRASLSGSPRRAAT